MYDVNNIESGIASEALKNAVAGDVDKSKELLFMVSKDTVTDHNGIIKAKELGFIPGAKVVIAYAKNKDEIRKGVITGFRTRVGGLYCGERYPVNVELIEEGYTFEYDLDSLVLCDDYSFIDKYNSVDIQLVLYSMRYGDVINIKYIDNNGNEGIIKGNEFLDTYNADNVYEIYNDLKCKF